MFTSHKFYLLADSDIQFFDFIDFSYRQIQLIKQKSSFIARSIHSNIVMSASVLNSSSVPVPSIKISMDGGNIVRINNIGKSQQDNRDYRGLKLTNGLKVLIVSDPVTDKSAAALTVDVGHMSDPNDIPGLAHFCEHMLFLGTEKYPNENAYSTFLSGNLFGGFDIIRMAGEIIHRLFLLKRMVDRPMHQRMLTIRNIISILCQVSWKAHWTDSLSSSFPRYLPRVQLKEKSMPLIRNTIKMWRPTSGV